MPDFEQRIKESLDRLGERPDPAQILERVGKRKRHLHVMRRVQTATLVAVVLAVVAGGAYGLTRAFRIGAPGPVPGGSPPPSASPTSGIVPCSDQSALVEVASQEGAAGTISTVWRVTNTATTPCRSFGYPGMDFHTPSGWLNVPVHRGGYPSIDEPPAAVIVPPGGSLYFVSYWGDVDTGTGPCQPFDRVSVTLPDNRAPAEVASSGCVSPPSLYLGPVTKTPPP